MAKVTRIKAKDPGKNSDESAKKPTKKVIAKSTTAKSGKSVKTVVKTSKKASTKTEVKPANVKPTPGKSTKKPFILIRPFVYFWRYVRDSWQEIRQVRWPSRKVTWKLFLAILVYTLLFAVIIMLLDLLFTWLFNTVIS